MYEMEKSVHFLTYCRSCIIPNDGLGFKGRNVGLCQQLINFIDDKSIDGWTMSNIANTIT